MEKDSRTARPGRSLQVDNVYEVVKNKISGFFMRFGIMVGQHPVWFSLVPLFLCIGLGFGMFRMHTNNNTEEIFTPTNAEIFPVRKRMKELFPDSTAWNFDAFGLIDVPSNAMVVFRVGGHDESTTDKFIPADIDVDQVKYNLFNDDVVTEMLKWVSEIKNITVEVDGKMWGLEDICARSFGHCVMDGEQYLSPGFVAQVKQKRVSYPHYRTQYGPVDLSLNLVGVKTEGQPSMMVAARVIKIRWFWRVDKLEIAKKWNSKFQDFMAEKVMVDKIHLDFAYSTSLSLEEELIKGTQGDVVYFTLTLIFMIFYSIFVSAGGDVVSTRALLACGGVLAAALGIVSAMGLLSLMGVDIVGFVGLMPFLVMGIGVDDMFLLMTAWGETMSHEGDVPHRVGMTFASAGIGITITTLTDWLAFLIGISSTFGAVRQFCIYTSTAVLFCYLANCTLFAACLSLHGDRVYGNKHCLTCKPVKSRQHYRDQRAGICAVYCCGGSVPTREFEDESACEKLPRFILPRLILNPINKILILLGLLGFFAWAIYGAVKLEPGMKYVDLVLRSSYYYKFSSLDEAYFGQRLAIAFIVDQDIDYGGQGGINFRQFMSAAQRDKLMDENFLRCWYHSYSRSRYFPDDPENQTHFMANLSLFLQQNNIYYNDVTFSSDNSSVAASRCYVLTKNEVSIFKQASMMVRTRDLVDSAKKRFGFKALVFQPVFIALEHTIAILPATLQTVGTAVAVMMVVTMIMLPQMLMVCLVTLNIVFIITCVFGSMYYMEITFSGISMIHVLMSVGFSVDFSAHICAAYLMSEARLRHDRARYALVHASGPIFNGGVSSLLGVSMLMMSESYFFRTFFKIMSMVITSGAIGSVLLMPIILSYIGPENLVPLEEQAIMSAAASIAGFRMDSLPASGQGTRMGSQGSVLAQMSEMNKISLESAAILAEVKRDSLKPAAEGVSGPQPEQQRAEKPEAGAGNVNQNRSLLVFGKLGSGSCFPSAAAEEGVLPDGKELELDLLDLLQGQRDDDDELLRDHEGKMFGHKLADSYDQGSDFPGQELSKVSEQEHDLRDQERDLGDLECNPGSQEFDLRRRQCDLDDLKCDLDDQKRGLHGHESDPSDTEKHQDQKHVLDDQERDLGYQEGDLDCQNRDLEDQNLDFDDQERDLYCPDREPNALQENSFLCVQMTNGDGGGIFPGTLQPGQQQLGSTRTRQRRTATTNTTNTTPTDPSPFSPGATKEETDHPDVHPAQWEETSTNREGEVLRQAMPITAAPTAMTTTAMSERGCDGTVLVSMKKRPLSEGGGARTSPQLSKGEEEKKTLLRCSSAHAHSSF